MTATYDVLYQTKEEELGELMNFFKFAYKPSSSYNGTCLFEIIDDDMCDENGNPKMIIKCVRCDSTTRDVTVWDESPPDGIVTCKVTVPFRTFHDVFWDVVGCQALVMGGGATVHNWAYKEALAFGYAFDMSSSNWEKYYEHLESENGKDNNNIATTWINKDEMFELPLKSISLKKYNIGLNNQLGDNLSSMMNKFDDSWNKLVYNDSNRNIESRKGSSIYEYLVKYRRQTQNENVREYFELERYLSQFVQQCYSYLSLEANYMSVTKTWNHFSMDHESTSLLSPIKWKNCDRITSTHIATTDHTHVQLKPVTLLLNYTKSDRFKNKMENFIAKYRPLKIVCQSMENLYLYGNDKGNIMLDSMLL